MVLAELGEQITGALRRLQATTVIDEEVVQDCVKAVCKALLQADVHVRVVQQYRAAVTESINNQLRSYSSSSSTSTTTSSSSAKNVSGSSSSSGGGSGSGAASSGGRRRGGGGGGAAATSTTTTTPTTTTSASGSSNSVAVTSWGGGESASGERNNNNSSSSNTVVAISSSHDASGRASGYRYDAGTGSIIGGDRGSTDIDTFKEINTKAAAVGVNLRRIIQKELVAMLSPERQPYVLKKGRTNVVMFVGLQGSGKTTTCTKYAHHYQRKGWRVALVCADTFRAGAFDQLKQNATKVRVPFYGSYTEADPVRIAEEGVEQFRKDKYDLVIVDTSGRHKQEAALFSEMKQVAEAIEPDDIVFVLDSHIGQACYEQAQAFSSSVDVGSVIVTKLDGHAKGGGALSAVAATGSPVTFLGSGEHFDDFEAFEPNSFVSRLLGLGDVGGLFTTLKEMVSAEKQQELIDRLSKGKFTLDDMGEQFRNVLNLGPISKVMSMIPGVGTNLIRKGQEQASVQRIKRFLYILDSMTEEELKCEKAFTDSRIIRVAQGSGTSVDEVRRLLEQHKQFSKMVGKMGKIGLTKESALQNLMRNPQQMVNKVQTMLDPRILRQMGGAGNVVNLIRELQAKEGGEDMQEMMRQMGFGGGGGFPSMGCRR